MVVDVVGAGVGKQLKMASGPSWPVKFVNQQKVIVDIL